MPGALGSWLADARGSIMSYECHGIPLLTSQLLVVSAAPAMALCLLAGLEIIVVIALPLIFGSGGNASHCVCIQRKHAYVRIA